MQIKNNQLKNLQNPVIIGVAKFFVLIVCVAFIVQKFKNQSIGLHEIKLPEGFGFTISIVFPLMVVNWYLEALRWKVSTESIEHISLGNACKVVLGGLALNWAMPFTTGDLVARLSVFKDKYQASSAAVLNRGIMMCFTLILGLYGMSFVARSFGMNGWFIVLTVSGFMIFGGLFKKVIKRFLVYFQELSNKKLLSIVAISLFRYLVFVFQFYLLLENFMPGIDFKVIVAGIGWIFLIRSSIPLFFGGVGVREASGIIFFEPYGIDAELVVIPIFLIWTINTVIPSIVGLGVILRAKPAQ